MLKNKKFNSKNLVIGTIIIVLLGSAGLIINKVVSGKGNKTVESVNSGESASKGFEDIESIEIAEIYSEGGKIKVKNSLSVENTIELEKLISLFNRKVPLPDEYYCVLYDKKFTINKKDGTKEEYSLLLGDKYILINDKVMNHRVEDADAVLEFTNIFNEIVN